jgi:hypothetical protein
MISTIRTSADHHRCAAFRVDIVGIVYSYFQSRLPGGRSSISWDQALAENSFWFVAAQPGGGVGGCLE